ncbi:glycosyltransferase [Desulfurobacterium indicum]|nr:glycosyltransferase [Desulfurobacterium indicum]
MISACVIVKNEEKNLPRLLNSLRDKFKEIIVVDTGSTDKTVEIAKNFGCKIYGIKWSGFADARNYAVSKATGDWVWHFDADFEIDDEEFLKAKRQLLLLDERYNSADVIIENYNIDGTIRSYSSHCFIHRNKPEIKWKGKVHEYLENAELTFGLDVKVKHFGYEDDEVLRQKALRNIELLKSEIEEMEKKNLDVLPEYAYKHFYLIQSYTVLGFSDSSYFEKVVEMAEKYFSLRGNLDENNIFDVHVYTYIVEALIKLERYEDARKYLEEAFKLKPYYADYFYLKALLEEVTENYFIAFDSYCEFLAEIDGFMKTNPFGRLGGLTFLSDKAVHAYHIASDKLLLLFEKLKKDKTKRDYLEKLWKKGRGLYTGIALSRILKFLKEDEGSILRKLYKLYSNHYLAYFEMGNYFLTKGEFDRAVKYLERSVELNPNFIAAKAFLAYARMNLGISDEKTLIDAVLSMKEYFEKTGNLSVLPALKRCLFLLERLKTDK